MNHKLPKLSYGYDALEPYIDSETMFLHHTKHHNTYVTNLNKIINENPDLEGKSVEDLLTNLSNIPENIQPAIINNAGGHSNHTFFWEILKPGTDQYPKDELKLKIDKTFGNFENFKRNFQSEALKRFGSGWTWLIIHDGDLSIISTPNQDSPLMNKKFPILGLDVWEHAYYLKYKNMRIDYINSFWKLVNWEKANCNFLSHSKNEY